MYMFLNYAVLINNFWNLSMKYGTVELVNKGHPVCPFVCSIFRGSKCINNMEN